MANVFSAKYRLVNFTSTMRYGDERSEGPYRMGEQKVYQHSQYMVYTRNSNTFCFYLFHNLNIICQDFKDQILKFK